MSEAEHIRRALARTAFNLSAPLPADVYDRAVPPAWRTCALAPGAKAVWILAHGGRAFWARARGDAPATFDPKRDPLDDFSRDAVARAVPGAALILYSERRGGTFCPLILLATLAGVGQPGRFGLLVSPRFGPWIGLRGVFFANHEAPQERRPLDDPCAGCAAPCLVAADARAACVLGREQAYCADQRRYHACAAAAYSKAVP